VPGPDPAGGEGTKNRATVMGWENSSSVSRKPFLWRGDRVLVWGEEVNSERGKKGNTCLGGESHHFQEKGRGRRRGEIKNQGKKAGRQGIRR